MASITALHNVRPSQNEVIRRLRWARREERALYGIAPATLWGHWMDDWLRAYRRTQDEVYRYNIDALFGIMGCTEEIHHAETELHWRACFIVLK